MTWFASAQAQQALLVAQESLTMIREHKRDCERRDDERFERDTERDLRMEDRFKVSEGKVEAHHQENIGRFLKLDDAARARWKWLIGLLFPGMLGVIATLIVFIVETHK